MTHRTYYLTQEAFDAHNQLKEQGRNVSALIQEALVAAAGGQSHHEAVVVGMWERTIASLEAQLSDAKRNLERATQHVAERGLTTAQIQDAENQQARRAVTNQVKEWVAQTGAAVTMIWTERRLCEMALTAGYDGDGDLPSVGDFLLGLIE